MFQFLPNRANVQRVVHIQGHRPLRALFFVFLGYLFGWYACTHPGTDKVQFPKHVSAPVILGDLDIGCGSTAWACNEKLK